MTADEGGKTPRRRENLGIIDEIPSVLWSARAGLRAECSISSRTELNGEIKYRFALDNTGKSVDVFSLQKQVNIAGRTFFCFACKERMVAKLGADVTHHFAHKANSLCSRETYLHKLAKIVFQEEYAKCLANAEPFKYEFKQRKICDQFPGHSEHSCATRPRLQSGDLTQRFRTIKVETGKNEFVPDITLESKNGKDHLFIEIAVTHKCSETKRRSQNRIIEISVRCEEDIEIFRSHLLSEQDTRIEFYNFKKDQPENMCDWFRYCNLAKKEFRLFRSGRWNLKYVGKAAEPPRQDGEDVVWSKTFLVDRRRLPTNEDQAEREIQKILKECLSEAQQEGDGPKVRACGFCEHFDYWGAGECEIFHEGVLWMRAVDCQHYSLRNGKDLFGILCD